MKKQLIFVFIFFIFSFIRVYAQQNDQGSLIIFADPKIDQMMDYHKKLSTNNPGFKGYRVQIFFDSGNYSKDKAKAAKQRFLNIFPDQNVYLMFDEPYYKVRVGNFRNKVEAEGFLNTIIDSYPEAFVVPDFVDFPALYDENGEKIEESFLIQEEKEEEE